MAGNQPVTDDDASKTVSFMAKIQELLQEWLIFVILIPFQCASYIHFDLYIFELIYGNTGMLAFDFIYIAINAYRCGFIHLTLDILYEEA